MNRIKNITQYMQQPPDLQDFRKIPQLFNRDDLAKMLKSINECTDYPKDPIWRFWMKARDKCILSILYYMGLRPKEALGLRYDDFRPKEIGFLIRGTNNHSKKDRILPIPKEVLPFLEEYLAFGRKSDYLFPSFMHRGNPLSSGRWKMIMRCKILKPSGLWIAPIDTTVPRTRSYSLRASFATRLLTNTKGNMKKVAVAMGHSDYRSLNKYLILSEIDKEFIDDLRNSMSDVEN